MKSSYNQIINAVFLRRKQRSSADRRLPVTPAQPPPSPAGSENGACLRAQIRVWVIIFTITLCLACIILSGGIAVITVRYFCTCECNCAARPTDALQGESATRL